MSIAKPNAAEHTVGDVMHSHYVSVDGFLTVADGITLMRQHSASVIIINRRTEHDELGIVLSSDIAKKVLAPNRPAERINLYEIMSKPVVSVRPEMNVRYCARLFDQFGLSLAPVVDTNQRVLGIVDYHQMVLGWLANH
ncbi:MULTISPECIES: CBS domain-containing protein [Vreelandella]|jgi:Mg/Co/Ni transporter MgtE|uniref:CBS domain-containing protein n=2 Tax=Vreelandella TaxID=3137766 RepID=A0A7C9KVV2_9GAMM|nr:MULTISPECIES: CBS domain-containing protein [Halomonas]NDL70557.1 CBS domain-containing protein [Halomonas alkaliphila]NYS43753.1 CBS domain-containing protein [Halomonas zhaodongensis]